MEASHSEFLLNEHLEGLVEVNEGVSEENMPLASVFAKEILRLRQALSIAKNVMEDRCWRDNPSGADYCMECGNTPRDGHKGACNWEKIRITEIGGEA
jgi:hypothetical protein